MLRRRLAGIASSPQTLTSYGTSVGTPNDFSRLPFLLGVLPSELMLAKHNMPPKDMLRFSKPEDRGALQGRRRHRTLREAQATGQGPWDEDDNDDDG